MCSNTSANRRESEDRYPADRSDGVAVEPSGGEPTVSARTILALALPALGVLAAPPLYLLLDTAVVGRLGAMDLAALGVATTIQAQVTTNLTFLSYGTTARAARLFGAGRTRDAIAEGVQATWVGWAVGLVLAVTIFCGAPAFTTWLAGDATIAALATTWLRVAGCGIPLILATLAGNGWLRGLNNTRLPFYFTLAGVIPSAVLVPLLVARFGIVGSAWANLIGEAITSLCFLACLDRFHRDRAGRRRSWRPQWGIIATQLSLGRDLILRSLVFQVAFLSAAGVVARSGASALAAHQVLIQVWNFLGLVLDSIAIAVQALVGRALGGGSVPAARATGRKVVAYSLGFAAVLAVACALGARAIPQVFTPDSAVIGDIRSVWPLLLGMIVLGAVVFALDGVLLGAGDAAFLRTLNITAMVVGFAPFCIIATHREPGLWWVWVGLACFIGVRLIGTVWRFRSLRWVKTGV